MDTPSASQHVEALVQKHEFTLYGETGDNGLRGTSRNHETRIQSLEKKVLLLCAVGSAVGAGGGQILTHLFS